MTATTSTETLQEVIVKPKPPLSPFQLAFRRFRKHKMAMFGVGLLAILSIFIVFGGFFVSGYCVPIKQQLRGEAWANCADTSQKLKPPSPIHPFGTDQIGRDVLARTIFGGQISLMIGLSAAFVEVLIGATVGAIAAFYGGWIDNALMRVTETLLIIPSLFLLIIGARFFGKGIPDINIFGRELTGSVLVIILIIGLTSWMYLARIVRANILSLRERDYISAAMALGASDTRLIIGHLIPNTTAALVVAATLGVAAAILAEAYVSFLGVGVQGSTATWGNMLDGAYRYLETAPWLWFFPGTMILLTVLGVNFVGDGLRDAMDPYSSKHL
jgi:peptide/nickel transport system permease protein